MAYVDYNNNITIHSGEDLSLPLFINYAHLPEVIRTPLEMNVMSDNEEIVERFNFELNVTLYIEYYNGTRENALFTKKFTSTNENGDFVISLTNEEMNTALPKDENGNLLADTYSYELVLRGISYVGKAENGEILDKKVQDTILSDRKFTILN